MNDFKIEKKARGWALICKRCNTYEALENQHQGFSVAKIHYHWWHKTKPIETRGYWYERMYGSSEKEI